MAELSSNARAWLDTIAKAEGTYFNGDAKGYRTMFGYKGELDTNKGHPDQVIRSGGYASAAAGRYQFMPATWGGAVKALGLDGRMTPQNQDQAALYLMRQRGVDPDQPISAAALNKLAPEWASLPTLKGNSYYGQPVKNRNELISFYQSRQGAAPNPGNGDIAVAAAPVEAAAPVAGGGGALAAIDLGALLGDDSSGGGAPAGTAGPRRFGTPAAAAALAQQADILSQPLASLQRQATPVRRMAGSPGRQFMQQLLALTQRPETTLLA